MFILKHDKEEMRVSIRTLQAQVLHLFDEIKTLKAGKTKPATRSLVLRTDEAPWGYKKDGSPRKRPGRPLQSMEVSS